MIKSLALPVALGVVGCGPGFGDPVDLTEFFHDLRIIIRPWSAYKRLGTPKWQVQSDTAAPDGDPGVALAPEVAACRELKLPDRYAPYILD